MMNRLKLIIFRYVFLISLSVFLLLAACTQQLEGTVTDKRYEPSHTELGWFGCGLGFDGKLDCNPKPKIIYVSDTYYLELDHEWHRVSEHTYNSWQVGDVIRKKEDDE